MSSNIYPPYFAAGFLFGISSQALFVVALIAQFIKSLRSSSLLKWICIVVALSALVVCYAYFMEYFMAHYGNNPFELQTFKLRGTHGPSVWYYYALLFGNFTSQVLWVPACRRPLVAIFVALCVNAGMLYEFYVRHVGSKL